MRITPTALADHVSTLTEEEREAFSDEFAEAVNARPPQAPTGTTATRSLGASASSGSQTPRPVSVVRPVATQPRARVATGKITDHLGAVIDEQQMVDSAMRQIERVALGYTTGKFAVAQLHAEPGLATLGNDPDANQALVASASRKFLTPLTAAGGICSPMPARYEQRVLATAERPVRDALLSFIANRGGVRYWVPETFSGSLAAGVGVWTEANDANPSNPTTKPYVLFDCSADEIVVKVQAITASMKVGNMAARFDPDRVRSWTELLAVEQASLAEETLLATMTSGSTPLTAGQVLGTARDVVTHLERTAATYRSRNRQSPNAPVTLVAPAWLKAMMRSDMARQAPGDSTMAVSDAEIASWFAVRSIQPVWSLDYQRFDAAQGSGSVVGWPTLCDVLLFSSQSWLFLDGGVLDLGVVRDPTLTATNDALMFWESFENVAKVDGWSARVRLDVCANGGYAAPLDIAPCSVGS